MSSRTLGRIGLGVSHRNDDLPGHGTHPKDLDGISWMDWVDSVREDIRSFNGDGQGAKGQSFLSTSKLTCLELMKLCYTSISLSRIQTALDLVELQKRNLLNFCHEY